MVFYSCSRCDVGRYSLTQPNVSFLCKTCPNTAVCAGGSEISLNQGYWRSSNETDNIIDCEQFSDVCL